MCSPCHRLAATLWLHVSLSEKLFGQETFLSKCRNKNTFLYPRLRKNKEAMTCLFIMTTDLKVFPHFLQVCLCGCWEQEWFSLQLPLSSMLQSGILECSLLLKWGGAVYSSVLCSSFVSGTYTDPAAGFGHQFSIQLNGLLLLCHQFCHLPWMSHHFFHFLWVFETKTDLP